MRTMNDMPRAVASRVLGALVPVLLVLAPAAPVAAQQSGRMWAAQTGPNHITLAWDSVPGAYEYKIFAGTPESLTGNLRSRPNLGWLSGSGRSAVVTGMQRVTGGDLTLVATDRGGRVIHKRRFNRVTRATTYSRIQPPDEVTAEATSATEVVLTWTPVPGATAYYIGRATGGYGYGTLCALCSTEPRYVDQDITPGAETSYTVTAIFPAGRSEPVPSNSVIPGETELATVVSKDIEQPVDGQNDGGGGSIPGGGVPQPGTNTGGNPLGGIGQGLPTMTTGQVHTATPATTTTTSTPAAGNPFGGVGQGVATTVGGQVHTATPVTTTTTPPGGTPTGQVATTTGGQPQTGTPTTTTGGNVPLTQAGAPTDIVTGVAGGINNAGNAVTDFGTDLADQALHVLSGITAPKVTAAVSGQGAVRVSWTEATAGMTQYKVSRRVNGGSIDEINRVDGSASAYTDNFYPANLFASGALQVRYYVTPYKGSTEGPYGYAIDVTVTTATPAPTTPVVPCKLDYQRADNMWAAFGRADGALGPESVTVAPGVTRTFITDWKYEKQRNDGTNYYGSHLRVAANSTSRNIRLQLRTTNLTNLLVLSSAQGEAWIRLAPGTSQQFQADLMQVYCEP